MKLKVNGVMLECGHFYSTGLFGVRRYFEGSWYLLKTMETKEEMLRFLKREIMKLDRKPMFSSHGG